MLVRLALFFLVSMLSACGSGDLLSPGTKSPDRALRDQTGRLRTLASFEGKPLVVYFYPKDSTPGCTREACAFRDAFGHYEEAGVQVVGVSTDDVESHAEFAEEHELPFPLLADTEGELTRAFGVRTRLSMASRVTFVLDAEGVIRAVFRDVDPGVHADEVLGEVARLGLTANGGAGRREPR